MCRDVFLEVKDYLKKNIIFMKKKRSRRILFLQFCNPNLFSFAAPSTTKGTCPSFLDNSNATAKEVVSKNKVSDYSFIIYLICWSFDIAYDSFNKYVINLKNESVYGQPCKEELFHKIYFFLAIASPQVRVSLYHKHKKALSIDHQARIKCPRDD